MSASTVSSDSLPESVGSSATYGIIAPPLGAPTIALVYGFGPFSYRVTPANSAASDSDADPHDSPAKSDYFAGLEEDANLEEFSKEDPSKDNAVDTSSATDEPPTQEVPVTAPRSPPALSAPIAPYTWEKTK
ncbi:hypothetical protein Tco_0975939 [Tanacetum coccineum]|uniref:Uncharacterized protein n=1 Tax=Tanacetum coccineum TaxID=301880 RepID=A0ABQ5EH01_9ASTR